MAATEVAGACIWRRIPAVLSSTVFTALHALHIRAELAGLTLVIWRFSKPRPTLQVSTLSTVSYYWHFMDVLWVYLLLLLWARYPVLHLEDICEPFGPDHRMLIRLWYERSSPFAIPTKKLAMWLFIIADAATFAACLLAYGFLRNGFAELAHPLQVLPDRRQRDDDDFHPRHQQPDHVHGRCSAKQGKRGAAFRWTMITAAGGADLRHPALARMMA